MNPTQRKALQDLVTIDRAMRIIDRGVEAGVKESAETFDELQALCAQLEEEHVRAAAHLVKVFRSGPAVPVSRPPPTPVPSGG